MSDPSIYTMNLPVKVYPFSRRLQIHGGPFRCYDRSEFDYGIKLAPEVNMIASLTLDIPDFGVPDSDAEARLIAGLAFRKILNGENVYAGCMGGTGRTGLFFALIVKALGVSNPVTYVRTHYKPRAVETLGQEKWIAGIDVETLRMRMRSMLWSKRLNPFGRA